MQNQKAVKAFKHAVLGSLDVKEFKGDKGVLCAKFLLWAVVQTAGFTREIIIDLGGPIEKLPKTSLPYALMDTVHDISSGLKHTKINGIFEDHNIDLRMIATNVPRKDPKTEDRHFALCFSKQGRNTYTDLQSIGVIQLDMQAIRDIKL